MEHDYRISTWRHDVQKAPYANKRFEGETVEECDKKALEWFGEESKKPEHEWDGMDIVRIDSPAVAEKTTPLGNNGKQDGSMDWQL